MSKQGQPNKNDKPWIFTGKQMCLASTTSNASYSNSDNTTDISFSYNLTTIKWPTELTNVPDGAAAQAFSQAIADCITSGETAFVTFTDVNGLVHKFDANSILTDGSTNGDWVFQGTGYGGLSGKIRTADLVCGASSLTGTACEQWNCDTGETRWMLNGVVLTDGQVSQLGECTVKLEPSCDTSTVSTIACATEAVTGVEIGDKLLSIAVVDCNNVIQSSATYNIDNNSSEVTEAVLTESCADADVEELKQCIRDINGVEWTWLSIVDVDGNILSQLFINSGTLTLGTPEGEPHEWISCVQSSDIEVKDKCFYDSLGRRYDGCEVLKFDNSGAYLESTYVVNEKEYTVLPNGLRGAFDCNLCIQYAGCFDPRIARFNSISFSDGHVIDLDTIYGVDSATTNDVIAEVTAYAGGVGAIPTEYNSPPSISCNGTNLHEFQFTGLSKQITEIVGTLDTYTFNAVGACSFLNPDCQLFRECVLINGEVYDAFVTRNVKTKAVVCAETISGLDIPPDEVFTVTENYTPDAMEIVKVNSISKSVTILGEIEATATSVRLLAKDSTVLQTATVSERSTSTLTGTQTLKLASKQEISVKAVCVESVTQSKTESKSSSLSEDL